MNYQVHWAIQIFTITYIILVFVVEDCMTRPTLCDRNAVCSRTSVGDHVCICNPGYRGDGTSCTRKYHYICMFYIV